MLQATACFIPGPLAHCRAGAMTESQWLVLLIAQVVAAFVCPPNICEKAKCPHVSAETCHGRLSTEGSLCGCCEVCMHELGL
ncbi:uncharacterized protein LOC142560738 isoform X2 [Dermacentor variabilis]|uniref:uncharacterized protein LOC142560738 isoform X2 n=1 Tax=Dermacentor variabilis TaxID=34621 RepID=UPI003F5C343B